MTRQSPWLLSCIQCGLPVERRGHVRRQYCSDACYAERKRTLRKRHGNPVCALCGEKFERAGNRQKFCEPCRPAARRAYTRDYNAINKSVVLAAAREQNKVARRRDPEKFKRWKREAWAQNREAIAERRKRPEVKRAAAEYMRRAYRERPERNVHMRMASAVYQALREQKAGRKWETLVGYTLSDLMRHLERQFLPGMTWENMGRWHIDHIVPRVEFRYKTAEEPSFKECWSLHNLRPLWAGENQTKAANRLHLL